MKTDMEIGTELYRLARHFPSTDFRENELMREAARRLMRPGTTYAPLVPEFYDAILDREGRREGDGQEKESNPWDQR